MNTPLLIVGAVVLVLCIVGIAYTIKVKKSAKDDDDEE